MLGKTPPPPRTLPIVKSGRRPGACRESAVAGGSVATMAAPAPAVPDSTPQGGPGLRASVTVAVATGVGNVLVYVLYAALSRILGPSTYGAFGALAGVALVAAVPAI